MLHLWIILFQKHNKETKLNEKLFQIGHASYVRIHIPKFYVKIEKMNDMARNNKWRVSSFKQMHLIHIFVLTSIDLTNEHIVQNRIELIHQKVLNIRQFSSCGGFELAVLYYLHYVIQIENGVSSLFRFKIDTSFLKSYASYQNE